MNHVHNPGNDPL